MIQDLNLLRVFDVLLEERSVTRTGTRLGLTQSAVSHALNRLRYMLGDELFVRESAGMQPTPRAVEMGPQVHAALNQLQAALAPSDFDPATSERRFAVVTGAYASAILAPPLASRLADAAPQAELVIAELDLNVLERMDARRVDFMVGSVLAAPDRFARETILTEQLVWVVRAGHPTFQDVRVDLQRLVSVPHVVMARSMPGLLEDGGERRAFVSRASWEDAGAFEAALASRGLTRQVGVSVPDTYTALAIASRTDMATLIPRRLALLSAQGGRVRLIDPPYESPSVDISLVYLRERLAEPAVAWMHEQIRTVAAGLEMKLILTALLVRDYDEAIAFYVGKLGFTLAADTDQGGGKRWVVVAPPSGAAAGGPGLLLARAVGAEQTALIGDQTGGRVFLFLETDDFARDHARMGAAGVRFLEAPRHEPYGVVAVFEDLYGNRFDLIERKS